jgi:hypothetical protein
MPPSHVTVVGSNCRWGDVKRAMRRLTRKWCGPIARSVGSRALSDTRNGFAIPYLWTDGGVICNHREPSWPPAPSSTEVEFDRACGVVGKTDRSPKPGELTHIRYRTRGTRGIVSKAHRKAQERTERAHLRGLLTSLNGIWCYKTGNEFVLDDHRCPFSSTRYSPKNTR